MIFPPPGPHALLRPGLGEPCDQPLGLCHLQHAVPQGLHRNIQNAVDLAEKYLFLDDNNIILIFVRSLEQRGRQPLQRGGAARDGGAAGGTRVPLQSLDTRQ